MDSEFMGILGSCKLSSKSMVDYFCQTTKQYYKNIIMAFWTAVNYIHRVSSLIFAQLLNRLSKETLDVDKF